MEKESIFCKWTWSIWWSSSRRTQIDSLFNLLEQSSSPSGPPYKARYTESNRRETTKKPQTHWPRALFSEQKSNGSCSKIYNFKWDIFKMKSFYKVKDTGNRTKWQATDCKIIFTNPSSDRSLISKIY